MGRGGLERGGVDGNRVGDSRGREALGVKGEGSRERVEVVGFDKIPIPTAPIASNLSAS
jgi:hypothetical protein